jgi:arabinogalactan endo-1,4-beta-galactosidase
MMSRKMALALVGIVAIVAVATPLAVFEVVMQRPSATASAAATAAASAAPTIGPTTAPASGPVAATTLPPIPADLSIHVNPVDGLRPDSMMGVDVSMLKEMEDNGARFLVNGVPQDCLQILKDHGVNWIRLRLWNDPTDANGQPLGGGDNDLKTTTALAVRAKHLGLKVLLDFHYSDWWADPGKQNMPKAWVGLSLPDLEKALYDYTANAIGTLAKAGAMPDMVQIGNELNGGMMWPVGKTWAQGNEQIGGYDALAALLKMGAKAVRDADPHGADPATRARIAIHLANGGDNALYRTFFDALTSRGLDFDVIGLSYYGYWHGPLADLKANMNDISQRYHKDVFVAETAYAYTLTDSDLFANLFGANEQKLGGYKATVQGQATSVRDVIEAVAQVPQGKGRGVFYWEPDWFALKGAGWKTGEGDEWENQAMFDQRGEALASMYVFRLVNPVSGSAFVPATITAIEPIAMKVGVGAVPALPATVKAAYSDDSLRDAPVTWQMPAVSAFAKEKLLAVQGTVAGSTVTAVANLTVTKNINLLDNAGFESGALPRWTVTGDTGAVDVSREASNVHSGTYAAHYWLDKPFAFTLSQDVTGLQPGTYRLSAWIQGGGGETTLQLFVTCGGATRTVDAVNKGWQAWTQPAIEQIEVTGGICTVGLKVEAPAGSWAFLDDVELVKAK